MLCGKHYEIEETGYITYGFFPCHDQIAKKVSTLAYSLRGLQPIGVGTHNSWS